MRAAGLGKATVTKADVRERDAAGGGLTRRRCKVEQSSGGRARL
jgi:hypothetical protein